VPIFSKCGYLSFLETSEPVKASNGIALPLPCVKIWNRTGVMKTAVFGYYGKWYKETCGRYFTV
jgi:hypothetical protein